jgi:hypothetical protein
MMKATLTRIGTPLSRIPVRHSCGHFEARFTRWNDDTEAKARGFLIAGSVCSTCAPQGRPVSRQFPDLASVTAHCNTANQTRK